MIVALFLLGAGGLIGFQSLRDIHLGHHVSPRAFTLVVLVGVIVTKEVLFRYVVKIGENIASTAVKTDAWHHRSDAITSAAAFIGISIAVVGGHAYASADDWAALAAAVVIAFNAYRLFLPALQEVMDAAPAAAWRQPSAGWPPPSPASLLSKSASSERWASTTMSISMLRSTGA